MRKQLINIVAILFCVLAFTTVSVNAQFDPSFEVKVPFDFFVKNVKFPAGKYKFGRLDPNNPDMVLVRNIENKKKMIFLTRRLNLRTAKALSELTFHSFGDIYLLDSIWASGENYGSRLIPTESNRKRWAALEFEIVSLTVK